MYNPVYDLVNFTVGFVEPSRENDADEFANAGSGTLVTVEGIKGILTAAHVVNNLPMGGLQLALFSNRDRFDFLPFDRTTQVVSPA